MNMITISLVYLLHMSVGLCDTSSMIDVEVGAGGDQFPLPTTSPSPHDFNAENNMPVLSEGDEYEMPTDLMQRLTGIGTEPSDEALEWAQNQRTQEATIINAGEEPLYLYQLLGNDEKEFIVSLIVFLLLLHICY